MEKITSAPRKLDDTEEIRHEQAKKLIEFLSRSGILEKLNSTPDRVSLINSLDTDTIEDLLERMNGIIVGTPISERKIFEFPGMVVDPVTDIPVYLPADKDGQKQLLEKVVIPGVKDLPPDEIPEVLATEINLLHMFQDGNGRLARLIYLLTQPGIKMVDSEENIAIIEKYLTQRNDVINFDASFIEGDLLEIMSKSSTLKDKRVFSVVDTINVPKLEGDLTDYHFDNSQPLKTRVGQEISFRLAVQPVDTLISLREFLFGRYINVFFPLVPGEKPGTYSIDCEKLIDSIKTEMDLGYLVTYFTLTKTMRVSIVLDMYKNPNKYPSQVPGMNLKDYYRATIYNNAKQDNEVSS